MCVAIPPILDASLQQEYTTPVYTCQYHMSGSTAEDLTYRHRVLAPVTLSETHHTYIKNPSHSYIKKDEQRRCKKVICCRCEVNVGHHQQNTRSSANVLGASLSPCLFLTVTRVLIYCCTPSITAVYGWGACASHIPLANLSITAVYS